MPLLLQAVVGMCTPSTPPALLLAGLLLADLGAFVQPGKVGGGALWRMLFSGFPSRRASPSASYQKGGMALPSGCELDPFYDNIVARDKKMTSVRQVCGGSVHTLWPFPFLRVDNDNLTSPPS